MLSFAALMYDPADPSAAPLPVAGWAVTHADAVGKFEFATADPNNLFFGWSVVVDPFPVPAN